MATTNTSYKDSGIAWIGKIPEEWDLVKAKYRTKIIPWYAYKAEEYIEKDWIPLIRIWDITDIIALDEAKQVPMKYIDITPSMIIKRDDILIALTGATIWKSTIYDLDEISLLNQRTAIIRPLNKMNWRFLFYFVKSESFRKFIDFECYWWAQENVSTSQIGNMFISIPPLPTQTAIANYLDTKTTQISEFTTKKKQLISLLVEQKQAIIHQAVTKGIDPSAKMKESGIAWIGQIPEEWEMRKVSRIFDMIGSGTTPNTWEQKYYENGTIKWINTWDLNDWLLYDCEKSITKKAFDDHSALRLYSPNSLIIAMYGATIWKLWLLQFEATTNQACCILWNSKISDIKYIYYWFISNKEHIIRMWYWWGQPNISQDTIKSLKIQLPPTIEEQQQIVSHIESRTTKIDQTIAKIEQEIELIQEYRTSLIYHAVTGKINVE